MTCQHCATDVPTFKPHCGTCTVRRAARLSDGAREAIIYHVAVNDGMEAAETFRARVDAERERLAGVQPQ